MHDPWKFLLAEEALPAQWYNLQADLPEPLPPVINPGTGQPIGPDDLAPLFIPIVGPFITVGTSEDIKRGRSLKLLLPLLVWDGVAQTTGVVLIIVGAAHKRVEVERSAPGPPPLSFVPELRVAPGAAALRWRL